MTTEPNPPQDQPNEFGFAGAATAPQPEPSTPEPDAERIAVPADDLTAPITRALDEAVHGDED
ncbi:hypothetical protein [Actinoplanes flavus]|uniref:Uncharacterized protein n=1 Tax=Actinoplanes flavus TaxID=2820290 RepID=A0ABS3UNZ7_9ACTN|nr:hypothetical protein [Actinoplanes flavus]MBO3740500.1 hypothetical protein [Actinoplanes flavus]